MRSFARALRTLSHPDTHRLLNTSERKTSRGRITVRGKFEGKEIVRFTEIGKLGKEVCEIIIRNLKVIQKGRNIRFGHGRKGTPHTSIRLAARIWGLA